MSINCFIEGSRLKDLWQAKKDDSLEIVIIHKSSFKDVSLIIQKSPFAELNEVKTESVVEKGVASSQLGNTSECLSSHQHPPQLPPRLSSTVQNPSFSADTIECFNDPSEFVTIDKNCDNVDHKKADRKNANHQIQDFHDEMNEVKVFDDIEDDCEYDYDEVVEEPRFTRTRSGRNSSSLVNGKRMKWKPEKSKKSNKMTKKTSKKKKRKEEEEDPEWVDYVTDRKLQKEMEKRVNIMKKAKVEVKRLKIEKQNTNNAMPKATSQQAEKVTALSHFKAADDEMNDTELVGEVEDGDKKIDAVEDWGVDRTNEDEDEMEGIDDDAAVNDVGRLSEEFKKKLKKALAAERNRKKLFGTKRKKNRNRDYGRPLIFPELKRDADGAIKCPEVSVCQKFNLTISL